MRRMIDHPTGACHFERTGVNEPNAHVPSVQACSMADQVLGINVFLEIMYGRFHYYTTTDTSDVLQMKF